MNSNLQSDIELTAVLNLIPYLDKDFGYMGERTLSQILAENEKKFDSDTFRILNEAISDHPSWGKIVLVDQSSTNNTSAWTDDLIQACTFRDADGNYYVTYRGTGDGRWTDNGKGMVEESTEMQEAAAAYFDEMAEKYLIDASLQGKKIIVSGHSKGGNEAQYTYMSAKHEEIIDKCISLDGQGFSEAAIKRFKEYYGKDYNDKLKNMYSINGQDDYVHDLGIVIIPKDNTYFVPTSGDGFASLHALENMLSDDNGKYAGLKWKDPHTGEYYEQGEIGKLAKKISENMMSMNPEDREGTAVAIMSLIDFLFQDFGQKYEDGLLKIGGVNAELSDYIDLLDDGIPVLIDTLVSTDEGQKLLKDLMAGVVDSLYEKYGLGGVAGGFAIGGLLLAYLSPKLLKLTAIIKVIDWFADTIEKIEDIVGDVKKFISETKDAVIEAVNKIFSKYREYTYGGKYATSNPFIVVDTYKLRNYASRIQNINRRISNLDSRLDSLYWKVGLLDLWNLMQADLMTGYSWRLLRCASYLNDTATDFDTVETRLVNSL